MINKIPNKYTKLEEFTHKYDKYVFDIWGVLYDGDKLFPEAIKCLGMLNDLNKTIILLSNSPKTSKSLHEQLLKLGLLESINLSIMTSGEFALESFKQKSLKEPCYFIGPSTHDSFKNNLSMPLTNDINLAKHIICSGFAEEVVNQDYHFTTAIESGTVFHCINPDQYALVSGTLIKCAGLLAKTYEEKGGQVIYYGKPFNPIYYHIQKKYSLTPDNTLFIGDSLGSDILGASQLGFNSLFVLKGIHEKELIWKDANVCSDSLNKLFINYKISPSAYTDIIRW